MKSNIIALIVGAVIVFILMRSCEGEPKIVTTTVTKIVKVTDTINTVTIKEIPKKVYIEKTKKGDTIVVYKNQPSETTIEASQFEVELLANDATANITITSLTKPLDVFGTIIYDKKETTTETIITRDASGLYIYGSLPITSQISPELGAMFQIKNKLIIGAGFQYNDFTRNIDATVTLAIKVW